MSVTIRPFTPDDYQGVVDVVNAVSPEYQDTVVEWRHRDAKRDPKCLHRRFVAEAAGRLVGFGGAGLSMEMYHPRKFFIGVDVVPVSQGQGIGRALYDTLMDSIEPSEPLSVTAGTREDRPRGVRFLKDRGFVEVMRDRESLLDLTAFDPAAFNGAESSISTRGIELKTLRELEGDPDRDRKAWEMDTLALVDMPAPEPITPISFEHFKGLVLEHPDLLPDAWCIAVHNGEYVGCSVLWACQGGNQLFNGATGVRRDHRRQGIAMAMKLRNIRWAKEHGYPSIRTSNEVGNRAMLSINERLGFVKLPEWISFRKTLREEV